MTSFHNIIKLFLLLSMLQACTGNGFHLRENKKLASQYRSVYLQGLPADTKFKNFFEDALLEAGGEIVENQKQAKSIINFKRFDEGRRVIAYTSERRAREYLVYLKIEYSLQNKNKSIVGVDKSKLKEQRLNIDRSYLYDPDFALGKVEEEKQVKNALYEEAARLILLKLKCTN